MRKVKRVLIEYDNGETETIDNIDIIMSRPAESLLAGHQPDGSFRILRDLIITYTPDKFPDIRPLVEPGL